MPAQKRGGRIKHLIPREHGSWAMWVVPYLIGVAAARAFTLWVIALFVACLLVFLARTALVSALRLQRRDPASARWARGVAFLELTGVAVLGAPAAWKLGPALVGVALLAAALLLADLRWASDRTERTVGAELLAVAGFSTTAVVGYVAAALSFEVEALVIWAVCFAYFSGSVFYVKMRLERHTGTASGYGRNARALLIYVFAVTVGVAVLVALGWLRTWVVLALSPWLIHMLVDALRPRPLQSIHRLGWTLVAHSLGFTVLSILLLLTG